MEPRGPVDWELAARLAGRMASPGPTADRAEQDEAAHDLQQENAETSLDQPSQ